MIEQYINHILEFANAEWIESVLFVFKAGDEARQKAYDFVSTKYMKETWLGEHPQYFIHLKSYTDVCCATMAELPTIDATSFDAIFFI